MLRWFGMPLQGEILSGVFRGLCPRALPSATMAWAFGLVQNGRAGVPALEIES